MAVPEDEWKLSGIYRDLVEEVSVIAVQGLTRGIGAGGIVLTLERESSQGYWSNSV